MDLERIRDARLVPFLLEILGDQLEPDRVRIHVLKELRSRDRLLSRADRPAAAKAIGDVLSETANEELRVQAALTLGEFTDIDDVLSRLSTISLARNESIDLRYAAFTSLERGGPTPECIALLRLVSTDETLGRCAQSVLSAWHIDG
jgi:HEAT repeat protein